MEHNSREYFEMQSEYWFNKCAKRIEERDAYKSNVMNSSMIWQK